MEKTALIIVDVQLDFLPGGALGIDDGDKVIFPLVHMARTMEMDYVIATRDWHPVDHISFKPEGIWPEHCVQGTEGAEITPELFALADRTISKGYSEYQEAYSGWDGKDLADDTPLKAILDEQGINNLIIGGLALDYCVKATALDARKNGYETWVAVNATRSVDYVTGCLAIAEMCAAGINMIRGGYE